MWCRFSVLPHFQFSFRVSCYLLSVGCHEQIIILWDSYVFSRIFLTRNCCVLHCNLHISRAVFDFYFLEMVKGAFWPQFSCFFVMAWYISSRPQLLGFHNFWKLLRRTSIDYYWQLFVAVPMVWPITPTPRGVGRRLRQSVHEIQNEDDSFSGDKFNDIKNIYNFLNLTPLYTVMVGWPVLTVT